jgi:Tol biopolymer transport system component
MRGKRWASILGAATLLGAVAVPTGASTPAPRDVPVPAGTKQLAEEMRVKDRERRAQRERWLSSAEARQQRAASRSAYRNLPAPAARSTVRQEFDQVLEELAPTGSSAAPDRITGYIDDRTAQTVGKKGARSLLVSSFPLRAPDERGQKKPVDLGLRSASSAFEPENPLIDLSLPLRLDDAIAIGRGEESAFSVRLEGAPADATGQKVDENVLVYPNVAADTDLVAAPAERGAELFSQLRSPESPETQRFLFELPLGAELRETDRGPVQIVRDGQLIGSVQVPVAVDAQGESVPTSMTIAGNALEVTTPHRDQDVAYPVLVDPLIESYSFGSGHTGWAYYDNYGYGYIPCPGDPSWCSANGNPDLLELWSYPTSFHAGQLAEWYWFIPHFVTSPWNPDSTTAWIEKVDFINFTYNRWSYSDWNPFLYMGIYDSRTQTWSGTPYAASGVYPYPSGSDLSGDVTINASGDDAHAVIFELYSTATTSIPYYRRASLGGTNIYLRDPEAPDASLTNHTLPGGWVDQATPTFDLNAIDSGLGIYSLDFYRPKVGGPLDFGELGHYEKVSETPGCTGGAQAPCPRSFGHSFSYDTAQMPEGINSLWVNTHDPLSDDPAHTRKTEWTVPVDRSPPEFEASGSLTTNDGQGYELDVHATDGDRGDHDPAHASTARSGVKSIEVLVDNERVAYSEEPCTDSWGSCSLDLPHYELDPSAYSEGDHEIKLVVTDQVGHTATDQWTKTIEHGPVDEPSSTPRANFPTVGDGEMNAIAPDGSGGWYIAGGFSYLGPYTGNGVALDAQGQVLPGSQINGTVRAVAPDGSGGWYVGGDFTSIGGQTRNRLAHILADGSLGTWDPNANGMVRTLAVSGSTVYVGGDFTALGGEARNRLAAIGTDGTVASWNPDANNAVRTLAVSGSTVYAGGDFTTIGSETRNRLAAIGVDGSLTSWNPDAGGVVYTLAVSGSTVYVGGNFTTIGGETRNSLAAIGTDGTLGSWNPHPGGPFPFPFGPPPFVFTLAVSGSTVYVGGNFTTIGGQTRRGLAAIGTDGTLQSWNPGVWNPDANNEVRTLAVSGSTVYVGGDFATIGGQTRNRLAAIGTDGSLANWGPNVPMSVEALAVSGSTVYAGGRFRSVGGQTRNRLAHILADGSLGAWDPNANGIVRTVAISGSTVYVGGDFTALGGEARNRLAAIGTDGSLASWNPDADGFVRSLAISGSTVYAGGSFTTIGGQTRNRLAAIGTDGTLATWNPDANSDVTSLAISGSTVYAGGAFTTIGGQTRNYLAAIGTDGTLASWNPDANNFVYSLAASDSTVYAGGDFTTIGGQTRNRLAAIATEGTLRTWNPNANNDVRSLAVSGSTVYASGNFTTIGGQTRNGFAAIGAGGALRSWDTNATGQSLLSSAIASTSSAVAIGGDFTTVGGLIRPGFAVFAIPSQSSPPTISGVDLSDLDGWVDSGQASASVNTTGGGVSRMLLELPGGQQLEHLFDCTPACPTDASHQFTVDKTALPEGVGTATVRVYAADGSESDSSNFETKVDHSGPEVELSGGLLDVSGSDLNVTATDGDASTPESARSGIGTIALHIDSDLVDEATQDCTEALGSCALEHQFTVDPATLGAGPHQLEIVATDEVGHATTEERTIVVGAPPAITNLEVTGLDGWVDTGQASVAVTAEDGDGGIERMVLELPGGQELEHEFDCTAGCPATASHNFEFSVDQLPEGVREGTVHVYGPGTEEATAPVELKVDHGAPDVATSGELAGSGAVGNKLTVDASDGDSATPEAARSGVKSVELLIDDVQVAYVEQPCTPDLGSCPLDPPLAYELDPNVTPSGEHTFTVVARDQLDNEQIEEWTATVEYIRLSASGPLVDSSPPELISPESELTVDVHTDKVKLDRIDLLLDGEVEQSIPLVSALADGATQTCANGSCDLHYTLDPGIAHGADHGLHTFALEAADQGGASAGVSNEVNFDVDPPHLELWGELAAFDGMLLESQTAPLEIWARDTVHPQPVATDSGMSKVTVEVDGETALSQQFDCQPACPDPVTLNWTYDKTVWGGGPHTVVVVATDVVGNESVRAIRVDPDIESIEPSCPGAQPTSVFPTGAVTVEQAKQAITANIPGAIAPSQPAEWDLEWTVLPRLRGAQEELSNGEYLGTVVGGQIEPAPAGAFTIGQAACLRPAVTTPAESHPLVVGTGDGALFANSAPQTDTVVRPTALGATVIQSIRGPAAPSAFSWHAALKPGDELQPLPDGGLAVVNPAGADVEPRTPPAAPANGDSPAAIGDVETQLSRALHTFAVAENETEGEVMAVIPPATAVKHNGDLVSVPLLADAGSVTTTPHPSDAVAVVLRTISAPDPAAICADAFTPALYSTGCLQSPPPRPTSEVRGLDWVSDDRLVYELRSFDDNGAATASQLYAIDTDASDHELLGNPGDHNRSPSVSDDGSKIVFQSGRSGQPGLSTINADGSGETQVLADAAARHPTFAPDGSTIYFFRDSPTGANGKDIESQLYAVDSDGTDQRQITAVFNDESCGDDPPCNRGLNAARPHPPAVSPNGTQVVFSFEGRLWAVSSSASEAGIGDLTPLTPGVPDDEENAWPSYSSEAEKLVYLHAEYAEDDGLWTIDDDGTDAAQLLAMPQLAIEDAAKFPVYSPDGDRIAYLRDGDVYTVASDGTDETQLLFDLDARGGEAVSVGAAAAGGGAEASAELEEATAVYSGIEDVIQPPSPITPIPELPPLPSVDDIPGYGWLSRAEKVWCAINLDRIVKCRRFQEAASRSQLMTNHLFNVYVLDDEHLRTDDTIANAFQHAYWVAMSARAARNFPVDLPLDRQNWRDPKDGLRFALLREGDRKDYTSEEKADVLNDHVGYRATKGLLNDVDACWTIRGRTKKAHFLGHGTTDPFRWAKVHDFQFLKPVYRRKDAAYRRNRDAPYIAWWRVKLYKDRVCDNPGT